MRYFSQSSNLLKVLAGSALALSAYIPLSATAQTTAPEPGFSAASLQGTYIYVNTNSDVASIGPITFDGNGGVSADLEISLPCVTPAAHCSRNVVHASGQGSYSVNSDGTGEARLELSTGEISYSFMISESMQMGEQTVATKVAAIGHHGGLAGQVVAPTWSRRGY